MYIHTENPCCIIAYNNIFTKQEIGRLELIINPTADYYRIDGFRIHQKWRNKGVVDPTGKKDCQGKRGKAVFSISKFRTL